MEKLRILFLITDLGKGGAERYLVDLCKQLQTINTVDFIIASLFDNNQYEAETKDFNIVNLNFQTFSFRRKNKNAILKKLLDDFKPHVIHTHRFLGEFISSYYILKNCVYVCHGHDNMEQFVNFEWKFLFNKKKLIQWLEKRYLIAKKYSKVETHFIANSKHTYDFYQKVLSTKLKAKVHLIYYGFDFEKFFNPEAFRKELEYPIKLINVGSFQPKKNQFFLVKVGIELRKRNIPFKITLVGDGALRSDVIGLIKENKLEEFFELTGIVHNVNQMYSSHHIYIHSAWYEPFGLVFLEAMASGLPIVSLDGKGNRDLIVNDKNGYLIYEQDEVEFVDKIMELWHNREKYLEMSNYAQIFAKQYDMKKHTENLIYIYKQMG